MPRTPHELYADYAEVGLRPDLVPDEARTLAGLLMQDPSYLDPKHINHAVVAGDVRQLYEIANPEPEA